MMIRVDPIRFWLVASAVWLTLAVAVQLTPHWIKTGRFELPLPSLNDGQPPLAENPKTGDIYVLDGDIWIPNARVAPGSEELARFRAYAPRYNNLSDQALSDVLAKRLANVEARRVEPQKKAEAAWRMALVSFLVWSFGPPLAAVAIMLGLRWAAQK